MRTITFVFMAGCCFGGATAQAIRCIPAVVSHQVGIGAVIVLCFLAGVFAGVAAVLIYSGHKCTRPEEAIDENR